MMKMADGIVRLSPYMGAREGKATFHDRSIRIFASNLIKSGMNRMITTCVDPIYLVSITALMKSRGECRLNVKSTRMHQRLNIL